MVVILDTPDHHIPSASNALPTVPPPHAPPETLAAAPIHQLNACKTAALPRRKPDAAKLARVGGGSQDCRLLLLVLLVAAVGLALTLQRLFIRTT